MCYNVFCGVVRPVVWSYFLRAILFSVRQHLRQAPQFLVVFSEQRRAARSVTPGAEPPFLIYIIHHLETPVNTIL